MPQLHFYVSDAVAKKVQQRAKTSGLSTSKYLANMVKRDIGAGWPEQFFETVIGGWQGEPLQRPLPITSS